ncbi:MAG: murein biosynthesis integral membrane protein MurJ [Actinomycetia bacterium]|nr:murein biosynthesis integral membrane protein MurJ [Actinomycetes bacterium]
MTTQTTDSVRNSTLVAAGIFLSRISGLIRTSLLAAVLGTSAAATAFTTAIRIPNVLQNLLGEGVLSASFIPVYAKQVQADTRNNTEEAGQTAGVVAGLLLVLTSLLVLVGVAGARPITRAIAWGLKGDTFELAVTLTRITFAGVGLLVLSAWCLGILNTHDRFFLSYTAPVVWNAAQIAVLAFVALRSWGQADAAEAVAWAVFVGSALQLLIQLPAVFSVARGLNISLDTTRAGVGEIWRRFVPAVLGRGVVQLSAFLDLALASLLHVSAIAALYYAQTLYILPISVFAMSVAAAELPVMSRLGHDPQTILFRVERGFGRIGFYICFVAVAYLTAGALIANGLFATIGDLLGRDAFGDDQAVQVGLILGAYSLGLPALAASRLLQNALYAQGDTRGPAIIAVQRVIVATAVGVVLMFQLDRLLVVDGLVSGWDDVPWPRLLEPIEASFRVNDDLPLRMGAVGLALGSAVGAWIELSLLRRLLAQNLGRHVHLMRPFRALIVPSIAAAVIMLGLHLADLSILPAPIEAMVVLAAGGAVYVFLALAWGVEEARRLVKVARNVFGSN